VTTPTEDKSVPDRPIDRLHQYALTKFDFPNKFIKHCGLPHSYFSKQGATKDGSVSSEVIKLVLDKYNNFNLYWLLKGVGNMELPLAVMDEIMMNDERAIDRANELATRKTVPAGQSHTFFEMAQDQIRILVDLVNSKDRIIKLQDEKLVSKK
jgi:hypothetical protein